MNAPVQFLARLIADTPPLEQLVIVCGIAESLRIGSQPLVRGLDPASFTEMCEHCVPGVPLDNGSVVDTGLDEFDELFELLMLYAEPCDKMSFWLAAVISTAAQRDNHLWQDMGLPSRKELSGILLKRFPRLAEANVRDMKWKKFFYRQLCQRAGVPICKSPNCADCTDYAYCFGPES
jgi:nitrogen fixation protein NifQ